MARLSWRTVNGSHGVKSPGNSHPPVRIFPGPCAWRHQHAAAPAARARASRNVLAPLPCSIRSTMRWLSMSVTLSEAPRSREGRAVGQRQRGPVLEVGRRSDEPRDLVAAEHDGQHVRHCTGCILRISSARSRVIVEEELQAREVALTVIGEAPPRPSPTGSAADPQRWRCRASAGERRPGGRGHERSLPGSCRSLRMRMSSSMRWRRGTVGSEFMMLLLLKSEADCLARNGGTTYLPSTRLRNDEALPRERLHPMAEISTSRRRLQARRPACRRRRNMTDRAGTLFSLKIGSTRWRVERAQLRLARCQDRRLASTWTTSPPP